MKEWFADILLWTIFILAGVSSSKYSKSVESEWKLNNKLKEGYNLDFPSERKLLKGDDWQSHVNNHFAKKKKKAENIGWTIGIIGVVILIYFGVLD